MVLGLGIIIWHNIKIRRCTMLVDAEVKDNVKRVDTDAEAYYHPMFEYTIDGQVFTNEYYCGTKSIKYRVGEKVKICFNPNNYKEYYVYGEKIPIMVATFFSFMGIVFCLVCFLCEKLFSN